ncbi:AraC family transcriptional regulator [Streptomyces sp. NBC_01005]|uniref:AraC family transcriptional regulator n=1 Tax=unclassified Streptomyces TaxID=2593676 RepID=UPI002E2FA9DF|nr:AraC family transcriptional regulator [Streptomyces sp. NBC_01362]WSW03017.1 AraC family transcriptional regulator [Streptomyces sp. NBC_01005]WTC92524.1 AraC family transcriptional regulator [Streptomyces sp. NBC_01650]
MDLLDDYLAGFRARGAAFCSTVSVPPWGMRFTDPAPLTLGAMLRGDAWLVPTEGEPVGLPQGAVALVRTRSPYSVTDRPDSRARVLVDGDDRCTLVGDPEETGRNWRVTGRTVGNEADSAADLLVTAGYRVGGDLCRPLLDALPPVTIVRPDPGLAALLGLIAAEVEHDEPGQQVVLDRFLDLLLVRALRIWFAHPGATPPPGYRALADPDIGHVLRRMHEEPARPWTVASLADEASMSRTAFARRFSALVGRPPLAYLTEWRMTLAADRLQERGASVAEVGKEVGYADGFAFSAAFKRVRGVSPSAHRDGVMCS